MTIHKHAEALVAKSHEQRTSFKIFIVACVLGAMSLAITSMASGQCNPVEAFKLTAADAAAVDSFGSSVAISGNVAIVGAGGNDDAGSGSGSAYLFDVATGQELFKLTASDAAADNFFGASVAISNNTAIVGAQNNDDAGSNSGSAYLIDVTTGQELFKLTASDAAANDRFGNSVAISGNTAIVGAYNNDDAGDWSGSAYLFDVMTGQELFKLTASDAAAGDEFGFSVAISGNTVIVGAYANDDDGGNSGSAYLFDVTTGQELFKLTASDAAGSGFFGWSVAISGNIAIVGAILDDDIDTDSGSAYLFDVTTGLELFKLTASDAALDNWFSWSVAISGNIAVVGAWRNDGAGFASGSAYLFDITTSKELSKLTASDAAANDNFGWSVTISGNVAIVGANGNDAAGSNSGSAYLFDLNCCLADIANSTGTGPDGDVNISDLHELLANWGTGGPGAAIAAPTNTVDVFDLLDLLAAWGACN